MSSTIRISAIDVSSQHEIGDVIHRPMGAGEYVFLRFRAPVRLVIAGEPHFAREGDCIIWKPSTAQWYRGEECGLWNDWFHFSGTEAEELLHFYGLPLDRIFHPAKSGFVTDILNTMLEESIHQSVHWHRQMGLYFEMLCLRLSREISRDQESQRDWDNPERLEQFQNLRLALNANYKKDWTVDAMAHEVHLSRPRFFSLYRHYFGVTPNADLTQIRLRKAAWLLAHTNLQVGEVARRCGFGSLYYFSRVFKKHYKWAPRDWKKSLLR